MKIFFSVELSEDVPKEHIFQTASTDDSLVEEYDQTSRAIDAIRAKAKLPAGLYILRFVLYYILVLCFVFFFMIFIDSSSVLKGLIFLLIYLGGIITGLYFIRRFEKNRRERIENSDEIKQAYKHLAETKEKICISHGAPEDCADTDILFFYYQTKKDRKGNEKITVIDRYNTLMMTYSDKDNLCLVALDCKYSIPLESLQRISTVEEHFPLNSWNKRISPDDEHFKKLGLITDAHGIRYAMKYHILDFSYKGEQWGIYFPCYELPTFEKLTGLKAESAKNKNSLIPKN